MKTAFTLAIKYICCFLITAFMLFVFPPVLANWRSCSSGIDETKITAVSASSQKPNILYAGTSSALYKSKDAGVNWRTIFVLKGSDKKINAIAQDYNNEKNIFIATDNGLYKSWDYGKNWKKIFRGKNSGEKIINHIAIDPSEPKNIIVATGKGLYKSTNSGKNWKKDKYLNSVNISWICFDQYNPQIIYAATSKGLYRSENNGKRWTRISFSNIYHDPDNISVENNNDNDEIIEKPDINCIAIDPSNTDSIYIGTDHRIFYSNDAGINWLRSNDQGLLGRKINRILFHNNRIFAATNKGIFCQNLNKDSWSSLDSGIETNQINCLIYTSEEKGTLIAGTDKGIYKYNDMDEISQQHSMKNNNKDIFEKFKDEPTIKEIQDRAIRYAEVNPEKIDSWRRGARTKALLPRLTVGYDHDVDNTYEIYTSSSKNYSVVGPDRTSDGWDISVTWDLGDLIWNNSQTSIDVRSRLMVQLRDDILDEVTKLYFERRRAQINLLTNPPKNEKQKIEKELRLQELTASIDALTGGYLSKQLKK